MALDHRLDYRARLTAYAPLSAVGRDGCCSDTSGRSAPVDDLGFVYLIARVVDRSVDESVVSLP
jgi:hypothetical protein